MRTLSVTAIIVGISASAALAGNYILNIDGKRYELDLGARAVVALQDGRRVQVELTKKDVAVFKTPAFSFSHPGRVTPARTDLGNGLHQTMMTTPSGTMVMIQEYSTTNPSGLVDFMLAEVLKQEVQYGYEITTTPATKELADGRTAIGKRAISKYRSEEYERYVVCFGGRDAGIMIVTQVEKASPREDLAMVELFWKTMSVSVK